jgi:hypothetical protein
VAPLGDYGGPTQTIALLPGSPAIDAGIASVGGISDPATDQRGDGRVGAPDIGAFESQGFSLAPAGGTTPQQALVNGVFTKPLVVTVIANDTIEPVAGGTVTFSAPAVGASASLGPAGPVTIGSNGQASVMAQANATAGSYTVSASAAGTGGSASFALTNNTGVKPFFTRLASLSIPFGTGSVIVAGSLAAAGQVPAGQSVGITLNNVTQMAAVGADGSFTSPPFPTATLGVGGAPYAVAYSYASDGVHFLAATGSSQLSVTRATPTISWANPADIFYGTPLGPTQLDATASWVVGGQTVSVPGSVAYTRPAGTVLHRGPNQVLSVVFTPADSTDYMTVTSTVTINVMPDRTETVLALQPVKNAGGMLVSVRLIATVESADFAGVTVTGTVSFKIKKRTLTTASLNGGKARPKLKVNTLLTKPITAFYGGGYDFLTSQSAPLILPKKSLQSPARQTKGIARLGTRHA